MVLILSYRTFSARIRALCYKFAGWAFSAPLAISILTFWAAFANTGVVLDLMHGARCVGVIDWTLARFIALCTDL